MIALCCLDAVSVRYLRELIDLLAVCLAELGQETRLAVGALDPHAINIVLDFYKAGKLADFCDHYVPASINLAGFLQTLVQSGNTKRFLNSMQSEYDKIEARNFR